MTTQTANTANKPIHVLERGDVLRSGEVVADVEWHSRSMSFLVTTEDGVVYQFEDGCYVAIRVSEDESDEDVSDAVRAEILENLNRFIDRTPAPTYTAQQVDDWKNIFGASAGMWDQWHRIEHLDGGGWDSPSRVRFVVDDPDDEYSTIEVTLTPADIFAALDAASDRFPWLFFRYHGDLDLDATSADVVLQVAVLGDVVYG